MKDFRRLLLACALAPVVWQVPARADDALMLLAQDTPTCTPGDPNCPPKPEVAPPPAEPQPEVAPPPAEPQPEVQPPPPEPQPEVQPPEPKPEVAPPQPETQPSPEPEVAPPPAEPKPEVAPPPAEPQPEVQPPASEPQPEPQPEMQPPATEVQPTAPKPEVQPPTAAPKPEAQPSAEPRPEGKPDRKSNRPPKPQPAPDAGSVPQPEPDVPSPPPVAPPAPDVPPPPAQPAPDAGTTPPAQPETSQTPPPAALIEKLSDPGAASAIAVGESLDRKAGNMRDVQRGRQVISNDNGVQVTVEPGGRVIVQSGDQAVIRHDDRGRFETEHRNFRERPIRDGGRELIFDGRDGGQVRTYYDENGVVIRREREDPQGRVFVLFGNRFGDGPPDAYDAGGWQPVVQLPPPPVYDLPRNRYRVETRSAPPGYVAEALSAPPLVAVKPAYTLDQVIYSPDLRDRVRSVDLDSITFPTGAWMVESTEIKSIESVARGISDALRRNPNEVFLVEGYTDAVGSVVDNLSLSDRRAESVARVLTDFYRIPPENLVTQGYGESYLKVPTEGPERANRRVTVRRITPLLATGQN